MTKVFPQHDNLRPVDRLAGWRPEIGTIETLLLPLDFTATRSQIREARRVQRIWLSDSIVTAAHIPLIPVGYATLTYDNSVERAKKIADRTAKFVGAITGGPRPRTEDIQQEVGGPPYSQDDIILMDAIYLNRLDEWESARRAGRTALLAKGHELLSKVVDGAKSLPGEILDSASRIINTELEPGNTGPDTDQNVNVQLPAQTRDRLEAYVGYHDA